MLTDFDGLPVHRELTRVQWDPIQAEKGGYKHFMLKEIWEQPRAVTDTTSGRVSLDSGKVFLGEMEIADEELARAVSISIAACGTSWHAALTGKYMIERLARMPVDVDYASEYRYRDPMAGPDALGLLITQSGETADTLAAQREMKALGSKTVAICNAWWARWWRARRTAQFIPTPARRSAWRRRRHLLRNGRRLFLLALKLGQLRGNLDTEQSITLIEELGRSPRKLKRCCDRDRRSANTLAKDFSTARDFSTWAVASIFRSRSRAR